MSRWWVLALVTPLAACALIGGSDDAGRESGVYPTEELGLFLQETVPSTTNEYFIGVGDRLDVVFFFHQDLTKEQLLVRRDGRITLPYVGDVMAAGFTPMQLDTLLENHFRTILRDPNLSVIVANSASQVVYVLGQVENAGGFPYDNSISLVQALALAGGIDDGARTDQVLVIRREGLSKIVGVQVNVKSILKGETVANDFLLRSYDIVFVPKTKIRSVADFAKALDDIFSPPVDLVLRGWQVQVLRQQLELLEDN